MALTGPFGRNQRSEARSEAICCCLTWLGVSHAHVSPYPRAPSAPGCVKAPGGRHGERMITHAPLNHEWGGVSWDASICRSARHRAPRWLLGALALQIQRKLVQKPYKAPPRKCSALGDSLSSSPQLRKAWVLNRIEGGHPEADTRPLDPPLPTILKHQSQQPRTFGSCSTSNWRARAEYKT